MTRLLLEERKTMDLDDRVAALMSLHGKTISATEQYWGHLALEFTDGTSFHIEVGTRENALPWLEYGAEEAGRAAS